MSIQDISSKIQTLQVRLDEENNTRDRFPPCNSQQQQGSGRRPSNLGGTPSARKKNLGLPPFSQPVNRIEPETEDKLRQIMTRNGILTINKIQYPSEIKDLEDLGELGNGTSGHVVKMKHKPTDKIIAVKQMRRTGNSEENKRIIMDIDVVLKSHDCQYIVHCLGCFITDADVWICMELMATCFDKLMKRSKQPVPEPILGKVTVATVRALSYLKDNHGVIHRDVKPSNILIDERGNIKLCDFGISGRLVDSKAKTRSAGCAAYMAPERIDPKKPEYDIRADVWSLGITLVELATGSFPYKGCNTDFEVLTHVLEADPPKLPTEGFSQQFQIFVDKCLTKNYRERPKYAELMETDFLKQYEHADVDVAAWFASVVNDRKSTELRRYSPNVPDNKNYVLAAATIGPISTLPPLLPITSSSVSTTTITTATPTPIHPQFLHAINNSRTSEPTIASSIVGSNSSPPLITSMSHIPVYQYNTNNYLNESNNIRNRISNNGYGINAHMLATATAATNSENQRIDASTFGGQPSFLSTTTTAVAQTQTTNETDRVYGQSMSPPTLYQRHPFPMNQNQLHREQLTELLRQTSADVPSYATSAVSNFEQSRMRSISPRTQSFPEQNAQYIGSPHRFQQFQYHTNVPVPSVATMDRHDCATYSDARFDNINKFCKTTLTLQGQHPPLEPFEEPLGKVLLKRDNVYNKLGHEALHRNNSLSPFLQRKLSLQTQQHRVAAYDATVNNRWHIHPGYGTSISASASPNLDTRKRFQAAMPAFDSEESSVVRLHGNTSPIVLQRFYHQQSQLREHPHRHASPQRQPNDFVDYSTNAAQSTTATDKMESNNHFLRHIPKLTQKLNPFKNASNNSNSHSNSSAYGSSVSAATATTTNESPKYRSEAIYTNSNIPIMKKEQRSSTLPPTSSPHHYVKSVCEYPNEMTEQGTHRPAMYGRAMNYKNGYETNPATIDNRDDHGWFNSLAGVVKRRFASYVKSHLASGENKKDRVHDRNQMHHNYLQQNHHHHHHHQQQQQQQHHQQRASSPYRFDKLRTGQIVAPSSSSMPSSPYCSRATIDSSAGQNGADRLQSLSPRVLSTIDRRHRSPDPPPRYNRGQSPLVLRRNLLEYGGQVNQSPLLPRRFVSPSPPLPPPRKGSDSIPGSPQQFRTRINYTPELQRRAFRAIDQ